jgi:hypothetical protein
VITVPIYDKKSVETKSHFKGLLPSAIYQVKVQAVNGEKESDFSKLHFCTTLPGKNLK